MNTAELSNVCKQMRRDIITMIANAGSGHPGGSLSMVELIASVFCNHMRIDPKDPKNPDRDRFVLSKGHAMEALYAVLADCGYLYLEDIKARFSKFGSPYIGHPNNKLPGIEMNSGSLGHGLPVCVGMALAARMDGRNSRIYTVMGDGELAEGSVWEGAMAAGNYRLDNLCAIVDRNRLQISGSTEDVMKQDCQEQRWAAFGWNVLSVDGNSIEALDAALTAAKHHPGQPTVIIANTIKGYGSALMENKADWHHHLPNEAEYQQILADFAARKEAAQNG